MNDEWEAPIFFTYPYTNNDPIFLKELLRLSTIRFINLYL